MSVQVNYKKQFILGFLLLIVALLVIESLARSYEWFNPDCDFIETDAMKNVDFFTKRQICVDFLHVSSSKDNSLYFPNQHHKTININSFGFRGDEISFEKSSDTLRIFMVGGSTVFGTGSTSDATTIPYYLQSMLNDTTSSKKIEVINAGVSGANSFSEKSLILNRLLDYKPDIIIGYSGWNDAWHRTLCTIGEGWNNSATVDRKPTASCINEGSKATSTDSDYLQHIAKVWRTPAVIYKQFFWDKDYTEKNHDTVASYNNTKDNQTAKFWQENWNDVCQKIPKNIPVILVLQPILGTGNKELSVNEEELQPKTLFDKDTLLILNSFADTLGSLEKSCTMTIDLRNVFDEYSDSIYLDKGHVNDLGNKIVAKQLDKEIRPIITDYNTTP